MHDWDEKSDGVLYFIQRLEEMLFHYSDDIVKAPIHNTATLILEYIELERNQGVQAFHLDMVANELRESLSNDPIVKDKIGVNKVQKIVESLKNQQKSTVNYLEGLISLENYYIWCVAFTIINIKQANAKSNIRYGLRAWISCVTWFGYTPEYIYRYLQSCFGVSCDNPQEKVEDFLNHVNLHKNNYRVYFLFMGSAAPYQDLLSKRLGVIFEDDNWFFKLNKKENKAFIGYVDVEEIDPYVAVKTAAGKLDIFISFYRVISNRRKELISKNAFVRSLSTEEEIKLPISSKGYNAIEIEPKLDLIDQIDNAVMGCLRKNFSVYDELNKIITLHNMALRQADLADGFVNLWSVLEVASKGAEKNSKIEAVVHSVLPVLQNDFFVKYFGVLADDLAKALSKEYYRNLLRSISQDDSEVHKIMYFVFLPEYAKLREDCFLELKKHPNIRQKIYKMYELRDKREQVFKLSELYATRLKWHLYRLYRVRNAIVHAGESHRNLQVLGEHLHIYCDGVILELIIKLSSSPSLLSITDVLLDTRLLVEAKKEHFTQTGSISENDIRFLLMDYFGDIRS